MGKRGIPNKGGVWIQQCEGEIRLSVSWDNLGGKKNQACFPPPLLRPLPNLPTALLLFIIRPIPFKGVRSLPPSVSLVPLESTL